MHKKHLLLYCALLTATLYVQPVFGQSQTAVTHDLVKQWQWTRHQPDSGSNRSTEMVTVPVRPFTSQDQPVVFYGMVPTVRVREAVRRAELSRDAFSMELWLSIPEDLNVGVLTSLKDRTGSGPAAWMLGYHDGKAVVTISTEKEVNMEFDLAFDREPETLEKELKPGNGIPVDRHHLVYTYDGTTCKLYWNGQQVYEQGSLEGKLLLPRLPELEIASYAAAPPIEFPDVLKSARLYNTTLSEADVRSRFESLDAEVENNL
jgi:hypothetical protein